MASSESENSPTTPDERGEEEQETKREVKIQTTDPEVNGEMVRKQLIVAVEGTAAVGPFWQTIFSDYLEKIVRCFCGNNPAGEKQSKDPPELSLIMFNSHGSYSACLVQRSGWTTDCEVFFQWLLALPFGGGGFNDAAIAEGLAEALMMFSGAHGNKNQTGDVQRHCILIAASNPYPLPTPVYRPQIQNLEKSDGTEPQTDNRLYDAETLAKYFPQCAVSLSIICPKQLQKLRGIYNAGKQNPRAADPVVDNVKNRHFLVLISENFMEARASLSRSGMTNLPSNQSPVKADAIPVPSISGPSPAPIPIANGSTLVRPPISVGPMPPTIAPPATVKVEPTTLPSVAGPTFPHISSVQRAASQPVPTLQASSPLSTSQDMNPSNETVLDMKPLVPPSLRQPGNAPPNVRILNDVARQALAGGTSIGLPSMGVPPMLSNMISSGMASANPTTQASMLSNMISSGMASSNTVPSQTVITSGPAGVTQMSGPSTIPANAQVVQNSAPASFIPSTTNVAANTIIGMSQPTTNPQGSSPMDQNLPGMSQGNVPVSQMVHNGMGMNNQSMMNNVASGMASGTAGTMMTIPGMSQQGQPGMQQPVGVNGNNTMTNMPLPQQTSSALQSAQSKYIKVWEGSLSGQRQGQPVFIAKLEGYRSSSAADSLAANWPQTMQIVRLISQDHMNNKQYVGKADFLVFRAMNQHGFLVQLQEKKLCAVIQLPSQTLLLSVSDKAHRLIGMLFPGDMVVFKPQPNQQLQAQLQQQPLQQQNLGQQPMPQNLQPMPQQQQPTQQNQMPPMQQQQQQQAILQMQQQQQQNQMPQIQQQNQMPQIQQQQNQMPQIQQQQNQMPQIQQQQQQQPQQQQMMVGPGMNQQQAVSYMQGRPQLGQVPAQGQPSMSGGGGGGFMS